MASNYWIKLYHETLDDPKMGRLTDRQYRRVIELFLLAGDYEMDGMLPPYDDIEFRLRFPDGLKDDLEVLQNIGIVSIDSQERYFITKWEDRQGAMTSTERSQRHRKAQRKENYYRNEDATNRPIDKEEEVEEIKNREDVEVDSNNNSNSKELIATFTEYTNIKPGKGADKLAKELANAGVICGDIIKAVDYLRNHPPNKCVSFKSLETSACIERDKRIGKQNIDDKEDYRKYTKGEFGEVGVH